MSYYSPIFLYVLLSASNCYLFSIIMPIYNTEPYIKAAIDSVINQPIGFRKNVELILVNDGSEDDCERICQEYQYLYQNNIIYVRKDHGGLSSARNAGLDVATGEIINFLDPDDILEQHVLEIVNNFFEQHQNIDLAAIRMKFFDARTDYHSLDYKFYKTRVADLRKEYYCIQLSAPSCFFKSAAIMPLRFQYGLTSGEDAKVINEILLHKPFLGIIREALYYYRKRFDGTSIVQTAQSDKVFYFNTTKYVFQYLLDKSRSIYGTALDFIQFVVMYDIQWRVTAKIARHYLSDDEYKQYCSIILSLLKQIDDKIILQQRNIKWDVKLYCLSLKYNRDVRRELYFRNGCLFYRNVAVMNLLQKRMLMLYSTEYSMGNLLIEARDLCWLPRDMYSYYVQLNNKTIRPDMHNYSHFSFETLFGTAIDGGILTFNVPLQENTIQTVSFWFQVGNNSQRVIIDLRRNKHIRETPHSYYATTDYIFKHTERELIILPYTVLLHTRLEISYWKYLYTISKGNIIVYRILYWLLKPHRKIIYLVSDRYSEAYDNGEYLFKYLMRLRPNGIRIYFCLNVASNDYKRLKAFGPILNLDSWKYKLYYLLSDVIISSSSNTWVDDAFQLERQYIQDLIHFQHVFLQHGIIKDDLSPYLHRLQRNFRIFVTSTQREYESLLHYDYYYGPSRVKLTGLPRYDGLVQTDNNPTQRKQILIIPTWRSTIKGTHRSITYESLYSSSFKRSSFFHFYNSLMNSSVLRSEMNNAGYKGIFVLHPSLREQWIDFTQNEVFSIIKEQINYQTLFLQSSLLVTDYSSIFFDFAYLLKPVVYSQFDIEEYRAFHYSTGYFSYLNDGFGPVCHDLQTTIDAIITLIRRNCSMEPIYKNRAMTFFTFHDQSYCERVYNEIRQLSFPTFPSIRRILGLMVGALLYILVQSMRTLFTHHYNKPFHRSSYKIE